MYKKLHSGSSVTLGDTLLMLVLLGLHHSFTWTAMLDVINFLNKTFDEDIINISKYKLFKYFPTKDHWFNYHIYCKKCKKYIGKRSDLESVQRLTCISCFEVIDDVKNSPHFITLNVRQQLKELFENPSVQPHLTYRFDRKKSQDSNIEDVYDGAVYKHLASDRKSVV